VGAVCGGVCLLWCGFGVVWGGFVDWFVVWGRGGFFGCVCFVLGLWVGFVRFGLFFWCGFWRFAFVVSGCRFVLCCVVVCVWVGGGALCLGKMI